jgi:tetratricopeptide (TPR) repeat protein
MSESPAPFAHLPPAVWERLEAILNRFEDAWQSGERPTLEDYLAQADAERAALLCELVHIDLELRRRAGEPVSLGDYLARFPGLAQETVVLAALGSPLRSPPPKPEPVQAGPSSDTPCGLMDLPSAITLTLRRHPDTSGPALGKEPAHAGAGTADGCMGLPRIPGYEILAEVGRGGMGIVYKAHHLALNRVVALKMLRTGSNASTEEVMRFLNEAEAVARLHHPNIVQVHDVSRHERQPYFTMEFVEGGSLARDLAGIPQPARQAAALVEALARAVAVAHQHGVIHRDLKPSNVLLSGSPLVPKISDFGLAKRVEVGSGLTESGTTMGTPSYMAPEQAGGKTRLIGAASDIYGLGAILYECLTGRPPFRAETSVQTVMQVIAEEPLPPRRLNPKVPRDLETICLQCLHKDPARRYGSALALAEDLRRFLDGEPVAARPTPAWERLVKWARRRPAAAALVALVAVALVGLSVATALLLAANQRERAATDLAVRARLDAEQKQREAVRSRKIAEAKEREAVREREQARRQSDTTREVARFLTELFQTADPIGLHGRGFRGGRDKPAELTARKLLDVGARRVQTEVKDRAVKAAMLDTLGNVYRSLGELDKAEPMLKEGLAIREELLGKDHEDTAASLHHLAWLYHDRGKYRESEDHYRRALAIRRDRLGPRALPTAATMFNLAYLLSFQDDIPTPARMKESEQLLREVIAIRREQLSDDHRDVGHAKVALAVVLYGFANRDSEAKQLMLQGVRILGREENQDLVGKALLDYFASVQARRARRFDQAEKLHRSVLETARRILGEEHPLVGVLLGDLAGLLRQKGDLPGAEDSLRKALAIGRRCALGGHPLMIEGLRELGDLERNRGKAAEAEKLYREALEIARTFNRQSQAAPVRARLVDLLRQQGRSEEAAALAKAP